jgi:hypothetical protein
MGNLFSNIGEWRTVKVPVYTTKADYEHLISHRRELIKILDSSDCKLNKEQQHTLSEIRDQSYLGGKSRKHRKYTKRTKNLHKKNN